MEPEVQRVTIAVVKREGKFWYEVRVLDTPITQEGPFSTQREAEAAAKRHAEDFARRVEKHHTDRGMQVFSSQNPADRALLNAIAGAHTQASAKPADPVPLDAIIEEKLKRAVEFSPKLWQLVREQSPDLSDPRGFTMILCACLAALECFADLDVPILIKTARSLSHCEPLHDAWKATLDAANALSPDGEDA